MKLVKSLLLGSAAGLVAVAGAQAADLPVRKAVPVEYVRVCSAYGVGFFYIPGTETCLRISGRVRAEYRYFEPATRANASLGWRARARMNWDIRTATAYGTLRTFIRYEVTRNAGNYGGPGVVGFDLNKAFVQFAGITAGRSTSFFDFYANDLNWGGVPTGSDTYGNDPVVLAYTATFGAGFSATISLEDPESRRVNATALFVPAAYPALFTYAGQRVPDVVANLRVDQAWGSAQLAGAFHHLQGNVFEPALVPGGIRRLVDDEYGFAIAAAAKFNLPFLAPGDVLWLQATYAEGAINYLGVTAGNLNQLAVATTQADAIVDALGNVKKTDGWVLSAAFLHYWTPQIRQSIHGAYGRTDYAASVTTPLILAGPGAGARPAFAVVDTTFWHIGTNLIWSPVAALDIGVEVLYRVSDPRGRIVDVNVPPAFGRTVSNSDAWEARFRIQRDF